MNINAIHKEINDAMHAIAAKHGLNYAPNTLRYTTTSFRVTIEMVQPNIVYLTDDVVKLGLASLGSTIKVGTHGPGIVLKVGRGKYTVQLADGKTGSIAYEACSAMTAE